jgi:putative tryptophan/tyrosine transport system substrate-binding protein
MRRREFIVLAGSAAAWPLPARAQQSGMPVVGFLHSAWPEPYAPQVKAFHQSLKEAGYVEGQNVAIEYRWAENQTARLPILASELANRQVSVIVAGGSPVAALAAKSATTTIPIVFMTAADPVGIGLVASFNRPGGNVTGATLLSAELVAKRLGILRDLLPSARKIAMLVNPTRPGVDAQKAPMQAAAEVIGLAMQSWKLAASKTSMQFSRQRHHSRMAHWLSPPTHCFSPNAFKSPIWQDGTRSRRCTNFVTSLRPAV